MKMSKRYLMFGLLILGFAFVVIAEAGKPKPINWSPSYSSADKIPLGAFVFYESLKSIKRFEIVDVEAPLIEYIDQENPEGTLLFFNSHVSLDSLEINALLDWTKAGNHTFIASKYLSKVLTDTLGLDLETKYKNFNSEGEKDFEFTVSDPLFSNNKPAFLRRTSHTTYFTEDLLHKKDTSILELGKVKLDSANYGTNFIAYPLEKGVLFLHLEPDTFTNHFILNEENTAYTEAVASYFSPTKKLYFDHRKKVRQRIYTSVMYYFLSNKHLKWSYYFLIIGLLTFVFFNFKRTQRSIPIVLPPDNQSINFARTIASMYYKERDHKSATDFLIKKLEYDLRTKLMLDLNLPLDKRIEFLHKKTNFPEAKTKKLLQLIEHLKQKEHIDAEQLSELSQQIDYFKRHTYGRRTKPQL
ncbi:MAG: DUF4350 domain-containing protein [Flavobacteriaceae bacterium]|nr:DUF4350 domain-containing protein [Flavobacteriaceae bacterium]